MNAAIWEMNAAIWEMGAAIDPAGGPETSEKQMNVLFCSISMKRRAFSHGRYIQKLLNMKNGGIRK